MGEVCAQYLAKGRKVAVVGEIQPRLYEAKDGATKMSLDVQADEVEFLTPKSQGAEAEPMADVPAEDCPF